jgi:hypothetical protein
MISVLIDNICVEFCDQVLLHVIEISISTNVQHYLTTWFDSHIKKRIFRLPLKYNN